ncbi:hypothetical protein E3N88_34481 [Mikania micrantha]|uniref:Glycine-rich protein n=1 Tax=Mikania micrantha TaxID=192012 RepID=A0A5N6LYI2_9ASTR|nr:hypothetical protein E3N88_34481 [Mikania micrantha]
MKFKSFILLCYLFALVLLVSSTEEEVQTIKDEKNDADKAPKEYHVNDGYGGGWGGYVGGDDWDGYSGGDLGVVAVGSIIEDVVDAVDLSLKQSLLTSRKQLLN